MGRERQRNSDGQRQTREKQRWRAKPAGRERLGQRDGEMAPWKLRIRVLQREPAMDRKRNRNEIEKKQIQRG